MNILQNEPLATRNTFRVGGEASLYAPVVDSAGIREVVAYTEINHLPVFVLGGGSNVLISDAGFKGLVVHMKTEGVSWKEQVDYAEVVAEAGESWDDLVRMTIEKGYSGLENLSGIPGTVGATPIQNIGAYGTEVKEAIIWVEAFDVDRAVARRFSPEECGFGYRDSFFKTTAGKRYIITRVGYRVSKMQSPNLSYKDLAAYFGTRTPTALEVREAVLAIRSRKFPELSLYGCAGSFFKNPILSPEEFDALAHVLPEVPRYPMTDGRIKVPAAYVIEKLGWKGKRIGVVGTYPNHSLVIVTYGQSTAYDIKNFSEKIIEDVLRSFSIRLEPEVQMIGN